MCTAHLNPTNESLRHSHIFIESLITIWVDSKVGRCVLEHTAYILQCLSQVNTVTTVHCNTINKKYIAVTLLSSVKLSRPSTHDIIVHIAESQKPALSFGRQKTSHDVTGRLSTFNVLPHSHVHLLSSKMVSIAINRS